MLEATRLATVVCHATAKRRDHPTTARYRRFNGIRRRRIPVSVVPPLRRCSSNTHAVHQPNYTALLTCATGQLSRSSSTVDCRPATKAGAAAWADGMSEGRGICPPRGPSVSSRSARQVAAVVLYLTQPIAGATQRTVDLVPSVVPSAVGRGGKDLACLVAVRRSSDRSVYNPWRRPRRPGLIPVPTGAGYRAPSSSLPAAAARSGR